MTLRALGWTEQRQTEFAPFELRGLVAGRIVSEHRSHLLVGTDKGETTAELAGRLWKEAQLRSDLPGVGDFVAMAPAVGDGPAIIEAVLSRTSSLIRQASGERRPQLIAANVDLLLIVTALDGDFSIERMKRYLAIAREGGVEPVFVINKADIADGVQIAVAQLSELAPDVPVHVVCARNRADVEKLATCFADCHTIALAGSSGVGKSTLVNQFLGRAEQATKPVRAHDNRGRHTTTARRLFPRPGGGAIIDTPGMRGLELWNSDAIREAEVDFSLISELAAKCKFRNCGHDHEPSCAVMEAVASGELDASLVERFKQENA